MMKFFCIFLGMHDWLYSGHWYRVCARCDRHQKRDRSHGMRKGGWYSLRR